TARPPDGSAAVRAAGRERQGQGQRAERLGGGRGADEPPPAAVLVLERRRLTGVHAGDDMPVAGPAGGAEQRPVGGVERRLLRPPEFADGTAVGAVHAHTRGPGP